MVPGSLSSFQAIERCFTRNRRPPIFLSGQLDRLTAAAEHLPLAAEVSSMLTPTFTNAATIAFQVRNAVIFDGSVYAQNIRHFIADRKLFKQVAAQRYLTTAGLTSTTIGARYLGHWLRDDCIQYLLAKTTGAAVSLSTPASDHKARYSDHKARYASYFGQDYGRQRIERS